MALTHPTLQEEQDSLEKGWATGREEPSPWHEGKRHTLEVTADEV